MSEVKRYDPCNFGGGMARSEGGAWYHMDDYDAIEAARDQYRDLSIKYGDKLSEVLKERDAALAELAALKGGREAVAMIRYARGVPGFENEMPHVVSCNTMPDGLYPVYLAPPAQASAWVPDSWRRAVYEAEECLTGCCASPDIADKIDVETVGKIIAHLQETRFAMLAAAPTPGASDGKGGES